MFMSAQTIMVILPNISCFSISSLQRVWRSWIRKSSPNYRWKKWLLSLGCCQTKPNRQHTLPIVSLGIKQNENHGCQNFRVKFLNSICFMLQLFKLAFWPTGTQVLYGTNILKLKYLLFKERKTNHGQGMKNHLDYKKSNWFLFK